MGNSIYSIIIPTDGKFPVYVGVAFVEWVCSYSNTAWVCPELVEEPKCDCLQFEK